MPREEGVVDGRDRKERELVASLRLHPSISAPSPSSPAKSLLLPRTSRIPFQQDLYCAFILHPDRNGPCQAALCGQRFKELVLIRKVFDLCVNA